MNTETPAPAGTTLEMTPNPSPSTTVQPVEPLNAPTIMPTVIGADPDTQVTETPVPETPVPSASGYPSGDSNVTNAIDIIEEEGARALSKAVLAWGLLGGIVLLYVLLGGLFSWRRKAPNPLTTLPDGNTSGPEGALREG